MTTRPAVTLVTFVSVARAALVALAFMLPFELKFPLFHIPGLNITNTELLLYLVVVLWGASWLLARFRREPLGWTCVHFAVGVWVLTLEISAVSAPLENGAALKFMLRSLSGCALFFATADLVKEPDDARAVGLALVAGSLLSALTAPAEKWLPPVADALLMFKTQPSLSASFLRSSGTFSYANISAMYWEASLPLLLTLGTCWLEHPSRLARKTGRRDRLLVGAAIVVIIEGIILSASRASLGLTTVMLLLLLAASYPRAAVFARAFPRTVLRDLRTLGGLRRRGESLLRSPADELPLFRRLVLVALVALITLAAAHLVFSPLLAFRLRSDDSSEWYRAGLKVGKLPYRVPAGSLSLIDVTVVNESQLGWRAGGDDPVLLAYHWYDPALGKMVVYDGTRTPFSEDVKPGQKSVVAARVWAPPIAGKFELQFDLVQEGIAWFSLHGNPVASVEINVTPATLGKKRRVHYSRAPRGVTRPPQRAQLWGAGWRMFKDHPLFGMGPDNFRHTYGYYLGTWHFDRRIHANSFYVETLANLGLLGVFALMALAACTWRVARPLLGSERELASGAKPTAGADRGLLGLGIAISVLCFYGHGLVDYFLEFTPTFGFFWVLSGLLVSPALLPGPLAAGESAGQPPCTPADLQAQRETIESRPGST